MIFLFTKSNKVGSRLIRWGLSSRVSHLAVVDTVEPYPLSIILESRLSSGVDITWLKTFAKSNEVVFALRPSVINDELSYNLFTDLSNKIGGQDYDLKGISFLAASVVICLKLLRRKLPKENKWADKNDFYCSESLLAIEGYLRSIGVDIDRHSRQMITPDRALNMLIDSGSFDDVTYLFKGK